MDIHGDYMELTTPNLSYNNISFWKADDSGYDTSFTPSCITYNFTPELKLHVGRTYIQTSITSAYGESLVESPITRRGIKRPFQDESPDISYASVPTPTSAIAGGIQRLKVNDNKVFNSTSSQTSQSQDSGCVFPSTPIKKICKTSCKLSPSSFKKSTKKLNFTIHPLSCEKQGLQAIIKNTGQPIIKKPYKPGEKVDIIKMLYRNTYALPALTKIFSYLSNEDIYNCTLVSNPWSEVWEQVSMPKKIREDFRKYLKSAKGNRENLNCCSLYLNNSVSQNRQLKEIQNIQNISPQSACDSPHSPTGSPRTLRFKKFTKTAYLDTRIQLSCVRCCQPAKVTEEISGEEWVQCTSLSCSYQYCKFCSCERHTGKECFQFDLDGPSPSKRKKNICVAGTKKSRKNLRRLL